MRSVEAGAELLPQVLTNKKQGIRSRPIRSQYSGHVICPDQSELIVCRECGQVSVSRERHTAHLTEPRHIHHYRSADQSEPSIRVT